MRRVPALFRFSASLVVAKTARVCWNSHAHKQLLHQLDYLCVSVYLHRECTTRENVSSCKSSAPNYNGAHQETSG